MKTNNYYGLDEARFSHEQRPKIGILISNLGTPDAPTPGAVRRYLREFLSDPRVIELNRVLWWLILNLLILPFRPKKSAANYQKVWTAEGSPLLVNTEKQRKALQARLNEQFGELIEIEIGMRYGNPSIPSAIKKLIDKNVDRLLILPMYPQYASVTIGTTFDAAAKALSKIRSVPETRFVARYHDEPAYIAALARSVEKLWAKEGRPEKLIFSFHGIPQRTFLYGDPYYCHCHKTARLVAEKLNLGKEEYLLCFQSLFGKEEWLRPYTIQTIAELAKSGTKKLDIICPGFTADCLETIEEIDGENREVFLHNGGEQFRYIPALNADPDFIEFLAFLALRHMGGWLREDAVTHGTRQKSV